MFSIRLTGKLDPRWRRTHSPKVTKAFHDRLVRLWKECSREFVRAAIQTIHVDTGMSRAQLRPLARHLRIATELSPAFYSHGVKPGHTVAPSSFSDNIAKFKSRALGGPTR